VAGEVVPGPLGFGGGEEDFVFMARQGAAGAGGFQQREIVLDGVPGVVLRQRAIDQQPVQGAGVVVLVTDPDAGINDARHGAVMHPALGVGVEGEVVALAAQVPQEPQGLGLARPEQVLLINGVEMGVALQQVPRPGPQHQGVQAGGGEIGAQLVNQRRGEQRIADARQ